MVEPWKIKQDDSRKPDSLPTFIIFCEDEVSEPIYFKFFETELIKVNVVEKQKSKMENVIKAITHCTNEKMVVFENDTYKLNSTDTHIWCVYDRDTEDQPELRQEGNTAFNISIDTARKAGIKVAWSNDSFELWVLLHFEEIDPQNSLNALRITYYDRLTTIFKSMTSANADLDKARIHATFSYKKDLKQKNNFRTIVREKMVGSTQIAIQRAKNLETFHSKSDRPNNEKSPCTLVHHLILDLIKLGGKKG